MLAESGVTPGEITCCGISGHSLGVVPLGKDGGLLRSSTPIWSDSRATAQAKNLFERFDEGKWYDITGNGFTPQLYSVFKILWYRDHEPEVFARIDKVIGTKDYINFRLTGRRVTDYSYASGSGVYDLHKWQYSDEIIAASGLRPEIFPEIVASTEVIGRIRPEVAAELGLGSDVQAVAGGC